MKKLIFRGPVMTASGYGVHARMVLKALVDSGKYDITVMSVPWGNTPLLYHSDPWLDKIRELSGKFNPQGPHNFDLSVQVTIPNEFMRMAPVNIGVTAGIEVDKVAAEWLKKCNENVQLVIVPSQHSMEAFTRASYPLQDQQGRPTGELRLQVPIQVVPEWVDTDVFNTLPVESNLDLSKAPAFNFLAVGLGFERNEGEDRKNLTLLVRWFCEQFRGSPDVGLVLKASMVNTSPVDFYHVRNRIDYIKKTSNCGELPRITLIHGRLSDRELAALYKHPKVKALVTLTHGEGYGLPIIEAAACGLPVVATNWSGHLDFLRINGLSKFVPVEYELKEIQESVVWKDVMDKGSKWAFPLEKDAKFKMAKVVASYAKPKEWATALADHIAKNYTSKVGDQIVEAVEGLVGEQHSSPLAVDPTVNESDRFRQGLEDLRKRFAVEGKKTLLFTMPGSAGDVFIATGVVNSLRRKYPEHHIRFATSPPFFSILASNPDVDETVQYEPWMQNVPVCEMVFDRVFTPNLDIQLMSSNWIRGGEGRDLAEEMAWRCDVEYGTPFILEQEPLSKLPEKYIVFHPGEGKGKHTARTYKHWAEVLAGLPKDVPILQVGTKGEVLIPGTVDYTGKTLSFNELAWVIKNAKAFVGIDSVSMHLAGYYMIPRVAIFGSSYAKKTGPHVTYLTDTDEVLDRQQVLLETPDRMGCTRACYKDGCFVDPKNPCINNIPAEAVKGAVLSVLQ